MKLDAATASESQFELESSYHVADDQLIQRQLVMTAFAAITALQNEVAANVPNGFLREKTPDELRAFLNGDTGAGLGIFDNTKLLAMGFVRTSMVHHPYKGSPFPRVPKEDWPNHVAFLDNTLVAPAARGRGFQHVLIDLRSAHAKANGARQICAGVNLSNEVSWRNLLTSGMVIVGIRVVSGQAVIGLLKSFDDNALRSSNTNLRLVATRWCVAHAFCPPFRNKPANDWSEISCSIIYRAICLRAVAPRLQQWLALRPDVAAMRPAYHARDPRARGSSGRFFGPHMKPRAVPARVLNRERRRMLWNASETLVHDYLQASI